MFLEPFSEGITTSICLVCILDRVGSFSTRIYIEGDTHLLILYMSTRLWMNQDLDDLFSLCIIFHSQFLFEEFLVLRM